jgi:hypothetical protein
MAKKNYTEHDLQVRCVKWFSFSYPQLAPLFFCVPNGAKRSHAEGVWMKTEGLKKGIADIILQMPNTVYSSLNIEMKSETGTQKESQKDYQAYVEASGGCYRLCRSFEEFKEIVEHYVSLVAPTVMQRLDALQKEKEARLVQAARAKYNELKTRNHE